MHYYKTVSMIIQMSMIHQMHSSSVHPLQVRVVEGLVMTAPGFIHLYDFFCHNALITLGLIYHRL